MDVTIEQVDGNLIVRGNTYAHKERLKRLGFRWDWAGKYWYTHNTTPAMQKTLHNLFYAPPPSPPTSRSRISFNGPTRPPPSTIGVGGDLVHVCLDGAESDEDDYIPPARQPQRVAPRRREEHLFVNQAPSVRVEVYGGDEWEYVG